MSTRGNAPSARAAALDGLTATHNGLGPGRVVEIQRARLLAAMVEVSCERGAGSVTVAHVVKRAGVSRRTFYEIFDDCEDCLLAAFDDAVGRASRYVLAVYDPSMGWVERIRLALRALLEFLDLERDVGRLLIVESLGSGTTALEHRRKVLAQIAAVVDEGRYVGKTGAGAMPLTAEGVVGAVFSVLHDRLCEDAPGGLTGLAAPLMSIVVLPYLGAAAGRRELSRRLMETQAENEPIALGNPLRNLEMRLTYRTVLVLAVIGDNPGSSNRMIGDAAGIADQGQVSKLLARLGKLGLIENADAGAARGDPNAWKLTERGEEINGVVVRPTSRG